MRDTETLAADTVKEVTRDRFTWCETDGVYKAVKRWLRLGQVSEKGVDLCIAADVAIENEVGAKFRCEAGDTVFESLTHITEG